MPTGAKLYVGGVVTGGGAVLLLALSQWSSANPIHFLIFPCPRHGGLADQAEAARH